MYRARVVAALFVLGLGVAVIVLARQLPYHSDFGPGPGFLPTWIGAVLVIAGAVAAVQELRERRTDEPFFRPRTIVAVKVLVAIVIAYLLVPLAGFAVTFGMFMLAAMRILGTHRWWACASAAAVTIVGVHQVFGQWLGIPLPGGVIGW